MNATKLFRWITLTVPFVVLATACTNDDSSAPEIGNTEQAVATTAFTATYTGQGANASTCNTSFTLTGQEPSTGGTFPVFLYMVGTTETATNASATAAVAGMASRGFVAATVAYDSPTFNNCTAIDGKAKCIFDPTTSTSAVSVLCARATADCSKGIVTGGFSQGAVIATQAKNFEPRIQAAWGMGDGVEYTAIFNLNACQANGNRTLTSDRLRVVAGQKDQFVGNGAFGIGAGTAAAVQTQEQTLTGVTCPAGTFNCLQPNGNGWYIVQNAQVQDGSADHCHMRATGDCLGNANNLDSGWQNGTDPWELNPNLDWLSGFATH